MESESFNYLSVLLAIVLGLAMTQVLQGLRGLILTRARVKLYLPTLIWAGLMLLLAIQGWWASFAMRTRPHWTFLALLVMVLHVPKKHSRQIRQKTLKQYGPLEQLDNSVWQIFSLASAGLSPSSFAEIQGMLNSAAIFGRNRVFTDSVNGSEDCSSDSG